MNEMLFENNMGDKSERRRKAMKRDG